MQENRRVFLKDRNFPLYHSISELDFQNMQNSLKANSQTNLLSKYKHFASSSVAAPHPVIDQYSKKFKLKSPQPLMPPTTFPLSSVELGKGSGQIPGSYLATPQHPHRKVVDLSMSPKRNHKISVPSRLHQTVDEQLNELPIPKIDPAKVSSKSIGLIKAYAANTHQGIIRDYNEDRVSIILNILQPANKRCAYWPKCYFFGIYDGHGGSICAEYLRDTLHHNLIKNEKFPEDPREAIFQCCAQTERDFLQACEGRGSETLAGERSGSCAIFTFIIDKTCYIGNVGDSRVFLSSFGGKSVTPLSLDHKPGETGEFTRILNNGGTVYQPQISAALKAIPGNENLQAPLRVFPGRLSVSRTFGDIEAKLVKYKGNPKVVIAVPDVKRIEITDNADYWIIWNQSPFATTIYAFLITDELY